MTDTQKWAINQKDEEGLKTTISILEATNHKYKKELIEYCESRLDSLNVGAAMVTRGEEKLSEFFQ